MKRLGLCLMLWSLMNLACSLSQSAPSALPPSATPPPSATVILLVTPPPPATPSAVSAKRCGDGLCDGPENSDLCPADCPAAAPSPVPTSVATPAGVPQLEPGPEADTYWVTNPASGVRWWVRVFHPQGWNGQPLPGLVLVPGGISGSDTFTKPPAEAQIVADGGFIVVVFDAEGRGQSAGEEDFNGYRHQDGLAAVVRAAAALPEVTPPLGLISRSYGVTMVSGALARHRDLPVRFFIDWEGPVDRYDTTYTAEGPCKVKPGRIQWVDCADEAYWSEREAVTFAAQLWVPYQRIQSQKDHVQPDLSNAVDMINAATQGGAPWTRLNDYPPNQVYDVAAPPVMFPDTQDRQVAALFIRYARELFQAP